MTDYQAAYLSLRESVLRIRDGDGPADRSIREQLDDGVVPDEPAVTS